jgi:hypothetical protein
MAVGYDVPTPTCTLLVHDNNALTDDSIGLNIHNSGAGDAALRFEVGGQTWSMGIDNSDSDKFKISRQTQLATNTAITIDILNAIEMASHLTIGGNFVIPDTASLKWGDGSASIIGRSDGVLDYIALKTKSLDRLTIDYNGKVVINQNLEVGGTSVTSGIANLFTADNLTTGSIAKFISDTASSGIRNLVEISNADSAAVNATVLHLGNAAPSSSKTLVIDGGHMVINGGGGINLNDGGDIALSGAGGNITMASGHLTLTSGNITMTSGDLGITTGDIVMNDGDISINNGQIQLFDSNGITCTRTHIRVQSGALYFEHLVGENQPKFVPPVMNEAEKLTFAPADGEIIFNDEANVHQGWDGSSWRNFY